MLDRPGISCHILPQVPTSLHEEEKQDCHRISSRKGSGKGGGSELLVRLAIRGGMLWWLGGIFGPDCEESGLEDPDFGGVKIYRVFG